MSRYFHARLVLYTSIDLVSPDSRYFRNLQKSLNLRVSSNQRSPDGKPRLNILFIYISCYSVLLIYYAIAIMTQEAWASHLSPYWRLWTAIIRVTRKSSRFWHIWQFIETEIYTSGVSVITCYLRKWKLSRFSMSDCWEFDAHYQYVCFGGAERHPLQLQR